MLKQMNTESKTKSGFIYLVRLDEQLKLGFTWNLDKRLRLLGKDGANLYLVEWVDGTRYIEQQLHEMIGGGVQGFYHCDYEQSILEAMHSMSLNLYQS
jgi:hypothetical protein